MSNLIQERYVPVPLAENTTYQFPAGCPIGVSGFLCVSSGTLTLTRADGVVVINGVAVTAGNYLPMPFYVDSGAVVVLAGGAAGTLGVS